MVLLPIQGDADLLLSFSEPRPTRSSATCDHNPLPAAAATPAITSSLPDSPLGV